MPQGPADARFIIRAVRWGRWSSSFRVCVVLVPVFLLVALGQLAGVRWVLGLRAAHTAADGGAGAAAEVLFWVLAGPSALGICGAGLLIGSVTRWRVGQLNTAFQRIATGDFRAGLVPLANRDFHAMQQTFVSMVEALDGAIARLREVDAQRRRLFADLAHELATPLTSLSCLTETLLGPRPPGREADGRLLKALQGEVERLAELVRDLKDLAHLSDPEMAVACAPTDVAEIALAVTGRLAAAGAGEGRIRCSTAPAPVLADPGRIDQVVVNLLTNALRHTPAGGPVEVRVCRVGAEVVLSVRDSGPGVPEDLLQHLGERLFRAGRLGDADGPAAGRGLGLAIVRAIVGRSGGRVDFANAPGAGLVATVRLPAIAGAGQGVAVADAVDGLDG